jgi:hypothetical protein
MIALMTASYAADRLPSWQIAELQTNAVAHEWVEAIALEIRHT